MYPFGKAINAEFYPLVDNVEATTADIDAILLDSIYIFSYLGAKPSLDAARSGTGALQTIASWTALPERRGFSYAISAVSDPDPESDTIAYSYWSAVNFRWATGLQVQTVLQELIFERVWGHTRRIGVTFADVIAAWPAAEKYATTTQINAYIELAKGDLRNELKAKGYEFAEIRRPDRLTSAVLYSTLSHISFGQIQTTGDHWHEQARHWAGISKKVQSELKFEYDGISSGATVTTNTQSGYRFVSR